MALVGGGVAAVALRHRPAAGPIAAPTTALPVPPGSSVPAAQKGPFDELMAQVAEIRGLQWRAPLNLKVVPAAEMSRLVRAANERDIKPEVLDQQSQALKLLHLIPSDTDLRTTLDDLLSGIVLGFYDPRTKELFVAGDDLGPATRYTIAHEMTHALTDQVFDYGPATQALDDAGRTEESAAYAALLEGDAVLTQELWAGKHLTRQEAQQAKLAGGTGDPAAAARVPAYVIQSLFFPYEEGRAFVGQLHSSGGFRAVDDAYRRPPTSTEQIIHPDAYLAGQGSPTPAIPNLAAATGCSPVTTGAVGEFDMRALLSQRLAADDAAKAVEGWNGDSFSLVRCGSALGLADRWETDPGVDPAKLVDALARWAGTWSGGGRAPGGDGRFSGPSGSGRVVRSGSHVDLVLAQDASTAERLVRALG